MAEQLYKVRQGDTVFSICLTNKIMFEKFIKLNPQFSELGTRSLDHLVPGEIVVVNVTDEPEPIERLRRLYARPRPKL